MVNDGNNKMTGNNKFGESLFIKKGAEPRDSAPPLMETKALVLKELVIAYQRMHRSGHRVCFSATH